MPEIVLTPQDKKYLIGKYKELYGELTNNEESKQKFLDLSDQYVNYKDKVLTQQSDEAIKNYFVKPWDSDINQAQNALRFKSGTPISSINDRFEPVKTTTPKAQATKAIPKEEKSIIQQKPVVEPAETFGGRMEQVLGGEISPMEAVIPKNVMTYGRIATTNALRSIYEGLGSIATGKVLDLFPGGGGSIPYNLQQPVREQLYKKYVQTPGEAMQYKPTPAEEKRTSKTARDISELAGGLVPFLIPGLGEESVAGATAQLTSKMPAFLSKVTTAAASQLPKVVPIVYAQSLDKGAEMGLTGDDLNNFARLNTALTWGAYSVIPNAFTGKFAVNDKIAKTILNPNSKTGLKLLGDITTRAIGSGVAGTTAAAGEMAAQNVYGPQESQIDMSSPEALKGLGTAFLTNAIIHTGFEARNIANAFKPSNVLYNNMVSDLALEKDKTEQMIKQSVEKGTTSKEDGDKAIALINKIEPYAKAAQTMPGIKPKLQGNAAFEMARLEDLVKERNRETDITKIQEYNNKIDKSLGIINSLQNGTNFRGELAKPQEIISMVEKHTPEGRLDPTQVMRMANEYGFKQTDINPDNFKNDPTVKEYVDMFKNGTMTPEANATGMPIVIDANGGIIDGKKRIAAEIYNAEKNNTETTRLEVLHPISESEIADGISDLNAVNPFKQAEYAKNKTIEFVKSMGEFPLKTTGAVSGVEVPEGGKLSLGDAVGKVYHTAKEKALESKAPVTEQDVLDGTLTGEFDGQNIGTVLRDFQTRYEAADEGSKPGIMERFVKELNKSKDVIQNPNVTAFRAAVEFAKRAGVPNEDIAKTLEGALGVKEEYIKGYMKVLEQKGLMPNVSKKGLFTALEARAKNVEVTPEVKVEAEVKPEEQKRKEDIEFQITQLEQEKQNKIDALKANGATEEEAVKIADSEMKESDKKAIEKLKSQIESIPTQPEEVVTEEAIIEQPVEELRKEVVVGEYNPREDIKDKDSDTVLNALSKNKIIPPAEPDITDFGDIVTFEYYDQEGNNVTRLTFKREKNGQLSSRGVKVEKNVSPIKNTKFFENYVESQKVEQPVEEAPKEEPKSLDEYVGKQVTLKDGTKGTVTKWEGGAGLTVKLDKGGSKLINPSEFKEVKEKPVPLPEEVQTATENEAPGSYDDATEVKPEPVVEEEVVAEVEVEAPEKELKTRKNEIIKSTNKKNLKDIFDILEKEGLLERDPNNTKDCI
jgi:hypothetical protein